MSHLSVVDTFMDGLDLCYKTQQKLYEVVLEDPLLVKYPPQTKYKTAFAKRVVAKAEEKGHEIFEPLLHVSGDSSFGYCGKVKLAVVGRSQRPYSRKREQSESS